VLLEYINLPDLNTVLTYVAMSSNRQEKGSAIMGYGNPNYDLFFMLTDWNCGYKET